MFFNILHSQPPSQLPAKASIKPRISPVFNRLIHSLASVDLKDGCTFSIINICFLYFHHHLHFYMKFSLVMSHSLDHSKDTYHIYPIHLKLSPGDVTLCHTAKKSQKIPSLTFSFTKFPLSSINGVTNYPVSIELHNLPRIELHNLPRIELHHFTRIELHNFPCIELQKFSFTKFPSFINVVTSPCIKLHKVNCIRMPKYCIRLHKTDRIRLHKTNCIRMYRLIKIKDHLVVSISLQKIITFRLDQPIITYRWLNIQSRSHDDQPIIIGYSWLNIQENAHIQPHSHDHVYFWREIARQSCNKLDIITRRPCIKLRSFRSAVRPLLPLQKNNENKRIFETRIALFYSTFCNQTKSHPQNWEIGKLKYDYG
jgi:hypothetical protein